MSQHVAGVDSVSLPRFGRRPLGCAETPSEWAAATWATYHRRRDNALEDVNRAFRATVFAATAATTLFVGLLAGVGLAGGLTGPMRDEAIKDLLQVAIVGVFGAVLTAAVNALQSRRDTRRQADELMRTWIGEVISVYQKIRDTRWRLEAQVTSLDGDRCITVADLDCYIPTVNDARLRFERMRDLCATHPAQPWRGLVADLRAIQVALRPVCDEYLTQRSMVEGAGSVPLDHLPQLRNFLKEDAEFKTLCGQVRRVVETLRDTLLRSPTPSDPAVTEA